MNAIEEQLEKIESFLAAVNKRYGKKTLYFLGTATPEPIECVSTGSLSLDLAIGGGERFMGIPHGRITEIWGEKETGKSTLCHHIVANAQRQGKVTAYFDYEHSYDMEYARAIGVDPDRLLIGQYTELEKGWEIVESMIRSLPNCVIIIDSIAAMSPKAEVEGEISDEHPGLQPRLLARAMRRNMGPIRENNVALVCVNQMRHKMMVKNPKFDESDTQPGGEALRHAIGLQIDMYPSSIEKSGTDIVARKIRTNIRYSKIARPFGKAYYTIVFGKGINRHAELIELAPQFGIIEQRGAYYYYNGERIAQGEDNAIEYLEANPDISKAIELAMIEKVNSKIQTEDTNVEV